MAGHLLTDVRAYRYPNKALAAVLLDQRLATHLLKTANKVKALYQSRVAVKSGRLHDSAHVTLERGGKRNDRWVAGVVIGGQAVRNPKDGFRYTLVHEFGAPPTEKMHFPPAHDLKKVLREVSK